MSPVDEWSSENDEEYGLSNIVHVCIVVYGRHLCTIC